MRLMAFAALVTATWIGAAQAQEPAAPPEALTDVYACAATADDAARLACYDSAVGRLRAAEEEGRVVAVDREQVAILERDSFGFSLPSLGSLLPRRHDASPPAALERIELRIARITRRADGRHHIVMENGQTWAQIEPQSVSNLEVGDTITIRRASLGSFMLSPQHGAAHRVRRVE
jgi:hypothetical protein